MYKAGIIGCGRIASILEDDHLRTKPCTHAGAYKKIKKIKLVAGCDINQERLIHFKNRWNISSIYTDYKEMLKKEKLDILSIATWTDSHPEITIAASKMGVKAIICEKPIALSSKEALKMINECERNNTFLFINHERRYDPYYQKAKEILKTGEIGKIKTVKAVILTNASFLSKSFDVHKSVLLHDGTHTIDILRYFFGDPVKINGIKLEKNKDRIYAIIEFKEKILAFIEASGDRCYFNFEIDISGETGRLIIGNQIFKLYKKEKSKNYTGFMELIEKKIRIKKNNCFIQEFNEVIDVLEGKTNNITSSGYDGYKALLIIEKIFESL